MRYFLQIAYSGTAYAGYQVQKNAVGVQNVLEERLSKLLKTKIELTGSGRTDAGVHCTKQFVHFDCETLPFSELDFLHKINAFLPKDIAVHDIFAVTENAHARFDAKSRSYQYVISLQKTPFFFAHCTRLYKRPDVQAMNNAAEILLGEHDFSSFCKLHTQNETNICKISDALFVEKNSHLIFNISANRFLRGMVRLIVGSLLEIGLGKSNKENFAAVIESRDVRRAGAAVPAEGLFLVNVLYPEIIFTDRKPNAKIEEPFCLT